MAIRIDHEVVIKRRRTKYPWDQWMDGSWWLLVRGRDYNTATTTMRRTLHSYAESIGRRAKTVAQEDGEGLYIKFLPVVKLRRKKVRG